MKKKLIKTLLVVGSLFLLTGCTEDKEEKILLNDLNTWKTEDNKNLSRELKIELEKETKPDFENTQPESKIYSNIEYIMYKPNLEIKGITAYVTIGEYTRYSKKEIEATELNMKENNERIKKEYEEQIKNGEKLAIDFHLGAKYTSKLVVIDVDSKGKIDNYQEEY